MSRKDYIAAAELIRSCPFTPEERGFVASSFADFFQDDNPRFSRELFLTLCYPYAAPAA